jgi:antitoxin (DNA-binding transcriptional repressor) of toxin-antitoxin stability system
MAKRLEEIDVTDLEEVTAIAEEVERTGEPKRLTKGGKDIAIISPVPSRRRRKTGIITESDPLFSLVGIGQSGVPGGFSSRKYDVFREHRRKQPEV